MITGEKKNKKIKKNLKKKKKNNKKKKIELILYRTRLTENTSWLPYILQTIHCCTERKQSIKQNMEEIGEDAKVLISRNTFLSPETIMCMCAGRCVCGGVDLNPCFIFYI